MQSNLWMLDVARGVQSRFTFRPGLAGDPVGSPDGGQIVYNVDNNAIYRKPSNGSGSEEVLLSEIVNGRPQDWSRDGKFIVYVQAGGSTGSDLWILPMEGPRNKVSNFKHWRKSTPVAPRRKRAVLYFRGQQADGRDGEDRRHSGNGYSQAAL